MARWRTPSSARCSPAAGGQYVYLRDAYHPLVAFLYGWALLFMIESGAMAAVAMTFAEYAVRLVSDQPQASALIGAGGVRAVAIGAIVFLSIINYLGVIPGSRLLNVFVVLEGRGAGGADRRRACSTAARSARRSMRRRRAREGSLAAFGAALIPIVFAYGGWQSVNYVAEEIKDPKRILPICLLLGTGDRRAGLRHDQRRVPEGARPGRPRRDDDAGVGCGAVAVRRGRRSVRDRGDRDLDLRLPEPLRAGADARLLRDGGRRRVLPAGGAACIRNTRRRRSRSSCNRRGRSR